ncbi:MAG: NAD(P)-binding domain-containing protein, partial [Actinomycetota bacterium]|nr:NAD(P)-binding domain-containing protein [Actinomycetota bacterium]
MSTPNTDRSSAANPRWGFIGAGRMASALVRGMIHAGVASPDRIIAADPLESCREALARETGIEATGSNQEVVERSGVVILAVKPQSMGEALGDLKSAVTTDHLIVSIAAGVSIETIRASLGGDRKIVRVMPNTPALLGEGASAFAMGPNTTKDDEAIVHALLESVGRA